MINEALNANWLATPVNFVTTREFDAANRETKLTYPDGSVVDQTYTTRDQLYEVKFNSVLVNTRVYDAGGRLESSTHGNGVVTNFNYRSDDLIAEINTTHPSGVTHVVGDYRYGWDANKNKTGERITGVMSDYGFGIADGDPVVAGLETIYDKENRLTQWTRFDLNQNHEWDLSPVGNWQNFTENNVTEVRSHTAAHEIDLIDNVAASHDAKGNLTSTGQPNSATYSWDQDNKLRVAAVPAGSPTGIEGTHEYRYDAIGRRVAKTVNDAAANSGAGTTTETIYAFAGQQNVCEYDFAAGSSPNPSAANRRFVYGDYIDEPILISRLSASPGSYENFYYSRNQQFSITALTDSAGEVVERYAYSAYGQPVILDATGSEISSSQFSNSVTYTGRELDPETGLFYFRARMYDAKLGRFISRDPLGMVDGPSLYRPYFILNEMDPSGLCPTADEFKKVECKIKIYMGHANRQQDRRTAHNIAIWYNKREHKKEREAAEPGTYFAGPVACKNAFQYKDPKAIPYIDEKYQIPGFPLTNEFLESGKSTINNNSPISEAYDFALKGLDSSVNFAYQLCENRNRYNAGGDDWEEYSHKPNKCDSVVIDLSLDGDFKNLVDKGTAPQVVIGGRNVRPQVIRQSALPEIKISQFKFNLNCDDVDTGSKPPVDQMPSKVYQLR